MIIDITKTSHTRFAAAKRYRNDMKEYVDNIGINGASSMQELNKGLSTNH